MTGTSSESKPRVELTASAREFTTERHLAILSTASKDSPRIHSVPVGFTVEADLLRIITSDGTQKVLNIERSGHATIAQVDGPRWVTYSGPATIVRAPEEVAHAVALYSARYRQPRVNPIRVVIEVVIDTVMGSSGMVTV